MYLSEAQAILTRRLITKLYTRRFDETLLIDIADDVCRLIGGDYFSFNPLASPSRSGKPLIVSNNPPDFIPKYLTVARKDFLLEGIIKTNRDYVLSRERFNIPENQDFIEVVQKARPISDIVYHPLLIHGIFCGFCGVARAELSSPVFSESELEMFQFISGFLNDAFERSLIPPPLDDDVAYFDFQGRVVSAGEAIRKTLDDILGLQSITCRSCRLDESRNRFLKGYRAFLRGPFRVGMDRLNLRVMDRTYSFLFSLLRPISPFMKGLPFASVRLLGQSEGTDDLRVFDISAAAAAFGFTPREREIIVGIYKGHSNKTIAFNLGIDESTVKRHTHNIYEKSGFKSRVQLILGLASVK